MSETGENTDPWAKCSLWMPLGVRYRKTESKRTKYVTPYRTRWPLLALLYHHSQDAMGDLGPKLQNSFTYLV